MNEVKPSGPTPKPLRPAYVALTSRYGARAVRQLKREAREAAKLARSNKAK